MSPCFRLHTFISSELFYHNSLDQTVFNRKGVWLDILLLYFKEIPVFNANSVDPDQMPHSGASDLGHSVCLFPFVWMLDINGIKYLETYISNY